MQVLSDLHFIAFCVYFYFTQQLKIGLYYLHIFYLIPLSCAGVSGEELSCELHGKQLT